MGRKIVKVRASLSDSDCLQSPRSRSATLRINGETLILLKAILQGRGFISMNEIPVSMVYRNNGSIYPQMYPQQSCRRPRFTLHAAGFSQHRLFSACLRLRLCGLRIRRAKEGGLPDSLPTRLTDANLNFLIFQRWQIQGSKFWSHRRNDRIKICYAVD